MPDAEQVQSVVIDDQEQPGHAAMQLIRALSDELDALRDRVDQLERHARHGRTVGPLASHRPPSCGGL